MAVESEQLRDQLQATLGANYTIERELGGGGMSRVFLATETTLNRSVVVKVLPPELAHAMSVERFRREIALSARLQHPHIVSLLTAGEIDGLPYYTMPFINGESLRARLTREGELPLVDIVRFSADPATLLLLLFGRIGQWPAILTGKLFAWGPKPWLGPQLRQVLRNP